MARIPLDLQPGKRALPGAPPIAESDGLPHDILLVGTCQFEVMTVDLGAEEVDLDLTILRLPAFPEERNIAIETVPDSPLLHQSVEFGESLMEKIKNLSNPGDGAARPVVTSLSPNAVPDANQRVKNVEALT